LGIRGRDGVFADYTTLPPINLHIVPDQISDDQAVFVEPLAAALEILEQVHVRPSDYVVLVGDGKLGQLIARILESGGCALTVFGRHASKLELLTRLGIDTLQVRDPSAVPTQTANVVIDATGSPSGFALAQHIVQPRGKIVLKSTFHGLTPTDLSQITVNEVQLIGSRCGPFAPALRLLARGSVDVEPLIDACYTLNQGLEALEHASKKGALKVLIDI
jgi:alcohol dehydrogenase